MQQRHPRCCCICYSPWNTLGAAGSIAPWKTGTSRTTRDKAKAEMKNFGEDLKDVGHKAKDAVT